MKIENALVKRLVAQFSSQGRVWSVLPLRWFTQEIPLTVFHPERFQHLKVVRRLDPLGDRLGP